MFCDAEIGSNPVCPLSPDYRQVEAEHVLIGASILRNAKAQRARNSRPGRWMGGEGALLDRAAVGTGLSQQAKAHRLAVEANRGNFARNFTIERRAINLKWRRD